MTLTRRRLRHHISLMHGWVPVTVQVIAAIVLVLAVGWRSRPLAVLWLPVAASSAVALAASAHWYIASPGAGR